jgi:hypothetical protein
MFKKLSVYAFLKNRCKKLLVFFLKADLSQKPVLQRGDALSKIFSSLKRTVTTYIFIYLVH